MWYSGWRGRGNWSSRNCPMFGKFSTPPCLCEIFPLPSLYVCRASLPFLCLVSLSLLLLPLCRAGVLRRGGKWNICPSRRGLFLHPAFLPLLSLSLSRNSRIKWGVRKRKADEEGEESGKRRLSVAASLATAAAAAESELGGRSRRN